MSIRAMLFDFDGTLADSFAAITASSNHVRQSYGLPALPETEIRTLVGHGLRQLMETLCPGENTDEVIERYRAHHSGVMLTQTQLYPGVRDTLQSLHQRGIRMGVCSNKAVAFTKQLVEALGLATLLTEVLGPEDVGVPKPDPAMLLEGCRRLGVSTKETIYVGDMTVDVLAGNAANIPVWLVHVGQAGNDDPRQAGPAKVFDHFSDILKAVELMWL